MSLVQFICLLYFLNVKITESRVPYESYSDTKHSTPRPTDAMEWLGKRECKTTMHSIHFDNIESLKKRSFIAVGLLYEQLSKSRMHFAEVLAQARLQNRVLILPYCENGRIGSSKYYSLPLCSYFDLSRIGQFIDWISEDFFFSNLSKIGIRHPRFIYLKPKRDECDPKKIWGRVHPFGDYFLKKAESPLSLLNNSPTTKLENLTSSNHICISCDKKLKNWKVPEPQIADIVVLTKHTANPCMNGNVYKTALSHLRYSNELLVISQAFIKKFLGERFLAVQWRLEYTAIKRVSHSEMKICETGLISSIERLRKRHRLTGIFLATDARRDGGISSTSMGGMEKSEFEWIGEMVKSMYEKLKPVDWTMLDMNFYSLDTGIRGILDKLVCAQALVFLFPPHMCFGSKRRMYVPSSYTREIIEIRSSRFSAYNLSITPKEAITMPWSL